MTDQQDIAFQRSVALNTFKEAVAEKLDVADLADGIVGDTIEEVHASALEMARTNQRGEFSPVGVARRAIANAESHEEALIGQMALKNARDQEWFNQVFGEGEES